MSLETLFYIAIFAIFVLYRMLTAGRKKGEQTGRPTQPQRPGQQPAQQRPADLDEALQEIRRALGWEMPEQPEAAPPPPAAEQPARVPTAQRPAPARTAPRATPSGPTPKRPTRSGTGVSTPSPTPRREPIAHRSPLRVPPRPTVTPIRKRSPLRMTREGPAPRIEREQRSTRHAEPQTEEIAPREQEVRTARLESIREQLLDPMRARDAFLMSVIFGGRRRRR